MKLLNGYDISRRISATVIQNVRITPNHSFEEVHHLVLELVDPPLRYQEGQSIGVLVPCAQAEGASYHLRLYSIASSSLGEDGRGKSIALCVRRCAAYDPDTRQEIPGIASNYLCDRRSGDTVLLTGPYDHAFALPQDVRANLLMIGIGTGIAPFRGFVKAIYAAQGGWQGTVRLFYGPQKGLEYLYVNDLLNDANLYYDQLTHQAFTAISPYSDVEKRTALDRLLEENAAEAWHLIQHSQTQVYVSGLRHRASTLDDLFGEAAGSKAKWLKQKEELVKQGRWSELLY